MNKIKKIISISVIFTIIFINKAYCFDINQFINNAADITNKIATTSLEALIRRLPPNIHISYEDMQANITKNYFIITNLEIRQKKRNTQSHTKIKKLTVSKVNVLETLSGENGKIGQVEIQSAMMKTNIIGKKESWGGGIKNILLKNLVIPTKPNEKTFSANLLDIDTIFVKHKHENNKDEIISSPKIIAQNIKAPKHNDKIQSIYDLNNLFSKISFEKLHINGKRINDKNDILKNIIK